MPISTSWSKLTQASLETVPTVSGVYEIGTLVRNTLYVGRSSDGDLRACLADELSKPRSKRRPRDLYFRYEVTQRDEQRLRQLLDEYAQLHGGTLPPLNQRSDQEPPKLVRTRPLALVERGELRAAC